jgi:hypothetical protein
MNDSTETLLEVVQNLGILSEGVTEYSKQNFQFQFNHISALCDIR